jgi:molybdopterin molybdotransferase
MRIMTGASLPEGADVVVPVESTNFNSRSTVASTPDEVMIFEAPARGNHIRSAGEDLKSGVTVFRVGDRLRPQDIGFLASLGYHSAEVIMKPRVAIFSSGDELVQIGKPLSPGKIYDSNSHMLRAMIRLAEGVSVDLGSAEDRLEEVKSILDKAVDQEVDLIISTAGVSVGAFDFVRQVIEQYGSLGFWRVNMRPGKPLVFGWYRNIPFIGLPGYPVSAFVGFMIFVRSAIAKMGGFEDRTYQVERVKLGEPVNSDGRESYLRARLVDKDGEKVAYLSGHQGSGNLFSLTQANALIIVPSGVKSLPAFSVVDAWSIEI